MVWEFESDGNDANGGGFDSSVAGGTDYTTISTPQATLTTASVVNATTTKITVKSTDYTVATTDVGNVMFLTGGTATTGFYEILSVTTGGDGTQTWNMDRAVGTAGQTCPGRMGGYRKLMSSNSLAAALAAGNTVWVKNGSYTMGAFSSQTAGTAVLPIQILGYNSSRGDNPTSTNRPTLAFGTNASTFNASTIIRNFIFTTSQASGVNHANNGSMIENCKITSTNATSTNGAMNNGTTKVINCEVINASGIGIRDSGASSIYGNYIHGCTTGVRLNGTSNDFTNNIVSGCTTAVFFPTGITRNYFKNNTFFGAETPAGTGLDGSTSTAPVNSLFENNIFYGFTTGVNWQASTPENWWDYNDFYNNTTNRTNVTPGVHDRALNPTFTNTSGGDFSIGTNLKAQGFPGAFQAATSTGYLDIGAVQRQEAASASNNIYVTED